MAKTRSQKSQKEVSISRGIAKKRQSAPKVEATQSIPNIASSSSGSSKKASVPVSTPKCPSNQNVTEISDPIIKSPLDTNAYKYVRLKKNGLRCFLISTCLHPVDLSGKDVPSCVFHKISEFNQGYCSFETNCSSGNPCITSKKPLKPFIKATERQEKSSREKRSKLKKTSKIKCLQGVPRPDNELEHFCNNMFCVVLFIKAGFFQDPQEMPGMAHFVEHVISLGSKNYSEPEAFSKFVETEGGGFSNARTEYEFTALYFYINHEHISEALDMFVDMLAYPKFTEELIPKEISAINSEFEGKRLSNEFRHFKLIQSCFIDDHPASNFGMGSKDTLTQGGKKKTSEVMKVLLDWMGRFYCTENMYVAIQGPKPIQELETLFMEKFSNVPTKFMNDPASTCSASCRPCQTSALPPVNWKKWNRLYYMVTSTGSRFMAVNFCLHPKFGKCDEVKPILYLQYILRKTEKGSLYAYLKEKGWVSAIHCNCPETDFYTTEYYTLVSLHLDLTEEGLNARMDILKAIFSYLNLLKKQKASKLIFDEVRQIQSDQFHYRSDFNINDPTIGRSFSEAFVYETMFNLLHTISTTDDPSKVFLNKFLITKYDPVIINELINSLKISQAMVVFGSTSFEADANLEEKWFQTKYSAKPICSNLINQLDNLSPYKEFSFPKANPFVAVSCCYPESQGKADTHVGVGLLAYESEKGMVTYGNSKCHQCLLPSAQYFIDISSPIAINMREFWTEPSMDVLVLFLKSLLDTELGQALNSLITYDLTLMPGGIRVNLSGPSTKLPQLGQIILETVDNLVEEVKANPKVVQETIRSQVELYKATLDSSDDCALLLLIYILHEPANFISDYVRLLETSYDQCDFLRFVEDFKFRLWIEADLDGCVTKKQAETVASKIDAVCFQHYRRDDDQILGWAIKLPVGERCLAVIPKNKENRNSLVINYYQIGLIDDDIKDEIVNAISNQLSEVAFEELRTKQGLGYFTDVELVEFEGIIGLIIFVQGTADTHTCGYINEKIDDFITSTYKTCFGSQNSFKETIDRWLSDDLKKGFATAKTYYEETFLPDGENFRKLSIQFQGAKKNVNMKPLQPTKVCEKVKKFASFKKRMPCGKGDDGGSCGVSNLSNYLELNMKGVEEENGYFITDIIKFKKRQECYGHPESD